MRLSQLSVVILLLVSWWLAFHWSSFVAGMLQSSLELDDPPVPRLPPPLEDLVSFHQSSSTMLPSPETITPLSCMPQSSSEESVMSGTGNTEHQRGRQAEDKHCVAPFSHKV